MVLRCMPSRLALTALESGRCIRGQRGLRLRHARALARVLVRRGRRTGPERRGSIEPVSWGACVPELLPAPAERCERDQPRHEPQREVGALVHAHGRGQGERREGHADDDEEDSEDVRTIHGRHRFRRRPISARVWARVHVPHGDDLRLRARTRARRRDRRPRSVLAGDDVCATRERGVRRRGAGRVRARANTAMPRRAVPGRRNRSRRRPLPRPRRARRRRASSGRAGGTDRVRRPRGASPAPRRRVCRRRAFGLPRSFAPRAARPRGRRGERRARRSSRRRGSGSPRTRARTRREGAPRGPFSPIFAAHAGASEWTLPNRPPPRHAAKCATPGCAHERGPRPRSASGQRRSAASAQFASASVRGLGLGFAVWARRRGRMSERLLPLHEPIGYLTGYAR